MSDHMPLEEVDLLDLDRFVRQEHHEMFRTLRAESPVHFHEEPDGPGFYNVTKYDDLVAVNRNPDLFSSEIEGISLHNMSDGVETGGMDARGLMMLMTDPPKHTRYRRLVSKGFTPRMIGMIEEYLEQRAVRIVDGVIEKGSCDFVLDVASELPLQAIAEIMGVPQEDRFKLFEWSNRLIGADDPEFASDDTGLAAMELYAYSNNLAKQRREDPRDDIVTTLINAEIVDDDGQLTRLTEMEFDAFMLLLAVAGNETTRNATAHGMLGLLTYPDQFEKLRTKRADIMDTAVDEIVRWATPVLHFRRTPREDTEIRGVKIPAGSKVAMWHISANRDEDAFAKPDEFDVERFPNDHIAFGGGGAHYCLGANLARMELRLIFDEIVRRMPDMILAGEPERLRSNFIGGIKRLPVEFTPGPKVGS